MRFSAERARELSSLSLTCDLRCARVGAVMAVFGDPANQEKQAISMTAPVVTGTQLVLRPNPSRH